MTRSWFSRGEVLVVAVVMLMTTMMLAAAEAQSKELQNRQNCANNLRRIMQMMIVYSADNNDCYPSYATPKSATTYDVTFKEAVLPKTGEVSLNLGKAKAGTSNPMELMWHLVAIGSLEPKQFVCESDAKAVPAARTNKADETYAGFQSGKNFSYSVTYPWTEREGKVVMGSWWRNPMDAGCPVLSDMAPYLGRTEADVKAGGKLAANETQALKNTNSANHKDGQNVAFADGHAEFVRTPATGEVGDSIWSVKVKGEERMIGPGILPGLVEGMQGQFDTVMVPTRDAKGDLK